VTFPEYEVGIKLVMVENPRIAVGISTMGLSIIVPEIYNYFLFG